jgi:chromosome segregation ATPase
VADERTIAFVRELERADSVAAATLGELEGLASEVEQVRRRALELDGFLSRLPAERDRADEALAEAERAGAEARRGLEAAEREVAEAEAGDDPRRLADAGHRLERARDHLHMLERRVEDAERNRAALEEEARSATRETEELGTAARRLAAELSDRPGLGEEAGREPAPSLPGIAEWASAARAALFVARASLANERDALVRQANELAAAVFGEPFGAVPPEQIVRRLEHDA